MAQNSAIEWTDATWNPILGCDKISPGCKGCYAIRTAWRMQHNPNPKVKAAFEGLTVIEGKQPNWTGRVNFVEGRLFEPGRWKQPRRIFVNSQSDLFHEGVTDRQIGQILSVIAMCPQHTFQVLTKRPERMRDFFSGFKSATQAAETLSEMRDDDDIPVWDEEVECVIHNMISGANGSQGVGWPMKNLWLGVSVENQKYADERIPLLLQTPAAVRWISAEPLLGPVDLRNYVIHWRCVQCSARVHEASLDLGEQVCKCGKGEGRWRVENGGKNGLHWVVAGGESGPDARPMHPDWARSLREQCAAAGVPYFFKQWGEWAEGNMSEDWEGVANDGNLSIDDPRLNVVMMSKIGKKAAGRLLDGKEWNQYPEAK